MNKSTRYTYPHDTELYYDEFQLLKKNGTTRRICAPSPKLLKLQQQQLPILTNLTIERIRYNRIDDVLHGFMPNRNCVTAASKHIGFKTTIIMDISKFFDTVHRDHFRALDITLSDIMFHKDETLAQGFATSPMAANLAITSVIKRIKETLDEFLDGEEYAFTVYADDIQISTHHEDYDTTDTIKMIVTECFTEAGFEIHPHKTRIIYSKHGYRRILGISVGDDHIKPSRKVLRKIRAARHQNNGPSLGGLVNYANLNLPRSLRLPSQE